MDQHFAAIQELSTDQAVELRICFALKLRLTAKQMPAIQLLKATEIVPI